MAGPADEAFARFQQSGNPGELARVFDETAVELLRVASHLVSDMSLAEDLVQTTFLSAMESRSDYDTSRPVLPWLLGILVNRARINHQMRARIPDPARLRRPDTPIPSRSAEAAELSDAITRAIASLHETYRPVLTLHLRHGLNAQQISLALERPPGTVRTQIVRGLDLLRRALPAGLTLATVASISSYGLAAVRNVVLTAASRASVGDLSAAATVGAMMMTKLLAISLGVLALAALTWLVWPPAGQPLKSTLAQSATPQSSAPALQTGEGSAELAAHDRSSVPLGEGRTNPSGSPMRIEFRDLLDRETRFLDRQMIKVADVEDPQQLIPVWVDGETQVRTLPDGQVLVELVDEVTEETSLAIPRHVIEDGILELPELPFGRELQMSVNVPRDKSWTTTVPGPRRGEEDPVRVVHYRPDGLAVDGILLNHDSVPMGNQEIIVAASGENLEVGSWINTRTLPSGEFRLILGPEVFANPEIRMTIRRADGAGGTSTTFQPTGHRHVDVGILTVSRVDFLGRGIVSVRGNPGARSLLRLSVERYIERTGNWSHYPNAAVVISKNGSFVIEGAPSKRRVRLVSANPHFYLDQPVEFLPGSSRITLNLLPTVHHDMVVQVGEGFDPAQVTLYLENEAGRQFRSPIYAPPVPEERGKYRLNFPGLIAGTYSRKLVAPGRAEPLDLGSVVVDGETYGQSSIDLRGVFAASHLDVLDSFGKPLEADGLILLKPLAATRTTAGLSVQGGRVDTSSLTLPQDVVLVVEGHRPEELTLVAGRNMVTPRPALKTELTVILETGEELPPGVDFYVSLTALDDLVYKSVRLPSGAGKSVSALWGGRAAWTESNRVYRTEVLQGMPYRLSIAVRESEVPRGKRPKVESLFRTEYVERTLSSLGQVTIPLDGESLKAAIKRVNKSP